MHPDGFEPGFEARFALGEDSGGSDVGSAKCTAEARGGVGHHGVVAVLEERKIGECVTDITEAVSELLAEGG
jgi:hypothetical protein